MTSQQVLPHTAIGSGRSGVSSCNSLKNDCVEPLARLKRENEILSVKTSASESSGWDRPPTSKYMGPRIGDDLAQTLEQAVEHLKTDRTENDIPLRTPPKAWAWTYAALGLRHANFVGKQVKTVGEGVLLACLATKIDPHEKLKSLALRGSSRGTASLTLQARAPSCSGTALSTDDVAKTNLWQPSCSSMASRTSVASRRKPA